MAGLAGALEPSLSVGDVVVDQASDFPVTDGRWRRGGIHTAGEIVATPAGKSALFRAGGDLVVEMENAFARRFAAERGVPFLGVRAVSDSAAEPLDAAVLRFVDPSGRVRLGRLAAELCRRPGLIPALWRLRSRTAIALRNLSGAVRQIVEEGDRR
jgi:nucleoside phosphorylase